MRKNETTEAHFPSFPIAPPPLEISQYIADHSQHTARLTRARQWPPFSPRSSDSNSPTQNRGQPTKAFSSPSPSSVSPSVSLRRLARRKLTKLDYSHSILPIPLRRLCESGRNLRAGILIDVMLPRVGRTGIEQPAVEQCNRLSIALAPPYRPPSPPSYSPRPTQQLCEATDSSEDIETFPHHIDHSTQRSTFPSLCNANALLLTTSSILLPSPQFDFCLIRSNQLLRRFVRPKEDGPSDGNPHHSRHHS